MKNIKEKVKEYITDDNQYKVIYENIYYYKNYNKLLTFLFLIMLFIYFLTILNMYD